MFHSYTSFISVHCFFVRFLLFLHSAQPTKSVLLVALACLLVYLLHWYSFSTTTTTATTQKNGKNRNTVVWWCKSTSHRKEAYIEVHKHRIEWQWCTQQNIIILCSLQKPIAHLFTLSCVVPKQFVFILLGFGRGNKDAGDVTADPFGQ